MQFSVVAFYVVSVALAANAISQINDCQIQATTATTATETSAPATQTGASSTLQISTQTVNGANQVAGGAAFAGLIAAGAMLI